MNKPNRNTSSNQDNNSDLESIENSENLEIHSNDTVREFMIF